MSIEPTDWPDLGVPVPRRQSRPCNVIAWPEGGRFDLASEVGPCEPEVERLLRSRRTDRTLGGLSVHQLGALLELSCRAQEVHSSNYGFEISLRPSPSAGAIHPVHLIFAMPGVAPFMRYDAIDHVLIETPTQIVASEVHRAMQVVLPVPEATLILLAAEVGKTAAKYEHPASLVWRDAGALLAVMGLSAHALGLGFCPLGVTGEPWVSGLLEQQGLFGVGAAFVGGRSPLG